MWLTWILWSLLGTGTGYFPAEVYFAPPAVPCADCGVLPQRRVTRCR